ncbi:PilZ domain-containing protein [Myxococcus sp. K15C18031901]|uniref:PilZ domain-containing protein n=1 Tax=Myxococcus dinghuensis TaxID=2906761 RepID=UPI0020A83726|nr:PilZ domain-containing protein [Myxococcus dinghuensis]MCP3102075.1 PilZ domain-containing protein [Myxococcus dinghuensis]
MHDDRRLFPRLQAPLYARPARLKFGDKRQVLDASLGGVRIYSDEQYTVGSQLEVDLYLSDGTTLECRARVAWINKLAKDEVARFEVGLAFMDITPETLERLKTVLVPEETEAIRS